MLRDCAKDIVACGTETHPCWMLQFTTWRVSTSLRRHFQKQQREEHARNSGLLGSVVKERDCWSLCESSKQWGVLEVRLPVGDPSMTCPVYGPSRKIGLLSFWSMMMMSSGTGPSMLLPPESVISTCSCVRQRKEKGTQVKMLSRHQTREEEKEQLTSAFFHYKKPPARLALAIT